MREMVARIVRLCSLPRRADSILFEVNRGHCMGVQSIPFAIFWQLSNAFWQIGVTLFISYPPFPFLCIANLPDSCIVEARFWMSKVYPSDRRSTFTWMPSSVCRWGCWAREAWARGPMCPRWRSKVGRRRRSIPVPRSPCVWGTGSPSSVQERDGLWVTTSAVNDAPTRQGHYLLQGVRKLVCLLWLDISLPSIAQ